MTVQPDPYQAAAQDVLSALKSLRQADDGELEQALRGLCDQAEEFCSAQCIESAITCCETARRLARQTRDSGDIVMFRYTEGFCLSLLGAIYLHCHKVQTAIECLRQAAAQFRDSNRLRSESAAWMAIGDGYALLANENERGRDVSLQHLERALSTYQRCLNIIESLRSADSETFKLKEQVTEKLADVNQRFSAYLDRNAKPSPEGNATEPTASAPEPAVDTTEPTASTAEPAADITEPEANTAEHTSTVHPSTASASEPTKHLYRVPIIESIAAGAGVIADNNIRGQIWLSREQVRDAKFAVRVEGHSMKGDGILDGDYVIIREQPVVDRSGAIAAVLVFAEGQTLGLLKHYYPESDHHRLEPSNENEPTLIVVPIEKHVGRIERYYRQHKKKVIPYKGDCQILGKPVALFREMP
jgi:SOS-response transcriptional repressor LexA